MSHLYTIAMLVISVAVLGAVLVSYHALYEGTCLDSNTKRNKTTLAKFPTLADLHRFNDAHRQDVRAKLDHWLNTFHTAFDKTRHHTGMGKSHPTPSAKASDHI